MQMSEPGLELLKLWEGFKLRVYKDPAGLPTIGVGHNILKCPTNCVAGIKLAERYCRDW